MDRTAPWSGPEAAAEPTSPAVTLHEERLRVGTESVPIGTVRVTKRVVRETRTVTVEVRREELVVDQVPALTGAGLPHPRDIGATPVLELVLFTEEPVVSTRPVPVELVRIYKDRTAEDVVVAAELRSERLDLHEKGALPTPADRRS